MEKIKNIFFKVKNWILAMTSNLKISIGNFFVKKETAQTSKKDFNSKNIVVLLFSFVGLFVAVVLFMPTKQEIIYRETAKESPKTDGGSSSGKKKTDQPSSRLWGSPSSVAGPAQASQNNYNTSMVVSRHGGNSKLELHAGTHLRVRIVEKFITSQEAAPVLGKIMEDATTESGLSIPKDSLLYGDASYQKASGRAVIQFKKISYPSGEVRTIQANVISPDGMAGLEGSIHSDGVKNSAGQIITTFVGGLAAGSMQRDLLGNSTGGITNGLLQAASDTAKDRAQKYGESLKESREWIEVASGTECEAVIQQSFKMIESEGNQ